MTVTLLGLAIFLLVSVQNPLELVGRRLLEGVRVTVGPYIRVMERDGDRLFVVEPERVMLFNTAGTMYYYLEGGADTRMCPHGERALVRITTADIRMINETGAYNVTCTATDSLNLHDHFESDSYSWVIPIINNSYSIVDIINQLINGGYVHLES